MKVFEIDGHQYKLPNSLNRFQLSLYIHLINWKWLNITKDVGTNGKLEYDAILPDSYADKFPMLYPQIINEFQQHHIKFPFRIHIYFNHMASSQAANINLFLPILVHPNASTILCTINPDIKELARNELNNSYRIEFWDEPYGNLNDKTNMSGTDSDIAIAYYNQDDDLCLWLIEHKLSEAEFTQCGGYKSKGRKVYYDCTKTFSEIIHNKKFCYYHDIKKFEYWNITETSQSFFINHEKYTECPFRKGMNQLWRNQLLGLSIENDDRQPYKKVHFSVVRHLDNTYLDNSIKQYKDLIGDNPKFSVFTSADILNAASQLNDRKLNKWIEWYKQLYKI